MDPNDNPFHPQNSSTYAFYYPNPNHYQTQHQASNQPQHIPNYSYPPNFFMPSAVPNYRPYYGSMMSYSSQPPSYSSTPTGTKIDQNVGATQFPEFSTQVALGGMSGVHEVVPDADGPTPARRRSAKWTTGQNLVLLSGWIKYGTDSIVGKNQKGESFWGKIAEYCNEHCKFDPPRDGDSCRNHYNYVNKSLSVWVGAYDKASRMQQSGWSEDDVLAKAHELYSSDGHGTFKYMKEWDAIRDQPRYGSQVRGNTGSGSSGSKRSHESDASDSNSVGSSARPMGRDAAKKKAKNKGKGEALEAIKEDWDQFKQIKAQEFERLDKIAMRQEEANQLMKMNMYLKLSEKDHLDDRSKFLLEKLSRDLFDN